jgi:hypothetical protein
MSQNVSVDIFGHGIRFIHPGKSKGFRPAAQKGEPKKSGL